MSLIDDVFKDIGGRGVKIVIEQGEFPYPYHVLALPASDNEYGVKAPVCSKVLAITDSLTMAKFIKNHFITLQTIYCNRKSC